MGTYWAEKFMRADGRLPLMGGRLGTDLTYGSAPIHPCTRDVNHDRIRAC